LFYANRDVQSVIFSNALLSLERDHPHRLEIMHWLESEKGLPTSADLFAFAKHSAQAQSYVCGPTPFIVACETALLNLGMDSQRIHIERFFSLSEEWQSNQNPITNEVVDLGAMTQVTLQLDDQLLQFQCASDETVMDAARRANIELPHACLAGICASCMCLVQSGSVFLRANEALDERDLAKGWTLACQALPTSAHLILKLST
jgi:3-ketosteroid 9alpha-monooxygenase subunit B